MSSATSSTTSSTTSSSSAPDCGWIPQCESRSKQPDPDGEDPQVEHCDPEPDPVKLKDVELGYSDFDLQIHDTVFRVHRHKLAKFRSFAGRIRRASLKDTGFGSIRLDGDERDVEDMVNTLKVLYASVVFGPFKFEPQVLISAFRVAKAYDYPALRTFCIESLEECEGDLDLIQRIELARMLDPTSREVATYDAMCGRDKPLTQGEQRILGMLAMRSVARVREEEMAKKALRRKEALPCWYEALEALGEDEEARKQREKWDEEYSRASNQQRELERMELEERKRGYEGALQRHQEWKMQEELRVKGRTEEPPRSEYDQYWEVGETSNPQIKGKSKAVSRAFSALSSRYLAVTSRMCGKPYPVMHSSQPEKSYAYDEEDEATLFDEYANDSKGDSDDDLDEKQSWI